MKKDVTMQILNAIRLFHLPAETFAASTWYVNDTAEYQAAEYTEETAAHTAAVLREFRISVHGDHAVQECAQTGWNRTDQLFL